eukprot:2603967-Rhodomonas_salina.1
MERIREGVRSGDEEATGCRRRRRRRARGGGIGGRAMQMKRSGRWERFSRSSWASLGRLLGLLIRAGEGTRRTRRIVGAEAAEGARGGAACRGGGRRRM